MAKASSKRTSASSSRAATGEKMRRRVLGDAYVDASLAALDDFNGELVTFIHEWVWNDIWTRPGLPLKTRSLINIALLTALNRPRELLIHLKGALNNGATVNEIKEVLLHTSLYAGVPATIDGFHIVREALMKSGHLPTSQNVKSTKVKRSKKRA